MARLDEATTDRLFDEKYYQQLERFAKRNRALDPDGINDWRDLFQTLVISVWQKTVDNFDTDMGHAENPLDAFDALFNTNLHNQRVTLLEKKHTRKRTDKRENTISGDEPVGNKDKGVSVFEQTPSTNKYEFGDEIDLANAVNRLPENVGTAVQIILELSDRANMGAALKEVRRQTGLTQKTLFNFLKTDSGFIEALPGAEKYV